MKGGPISHFIQDERWHHYCLPWKEELCFYTVQLYILQRLNEGTWEHSFLVELKFVFTFFKQRENGFTTALAGTKSTYSGQMPSTILSIGPW